jgi:Bacterial regulatory proteins, luxR family
MSPFKGEAVSETLPDAIPQSFQDPDRIIGRDRLFISEATVRNHLTSVLDKLGVSDRFELAVYAFRNCLVDYPEAHSREPL